MLSVVADQSAVNVNKVQLCWLLRIVGPFPPQRYCPKANFEDIVQKQIFKDAVQKQIFFV